MFYSFTAGVSLAQPHMGALKFIMSVVGVSVVCDQPQTPLRIRNYWHVNCFTYAHLVWMETIGANINICVHTYIQRYMQKFNIVYIFVYSTKYNITQSKLHFSVIGFSFTSMEKKLDATMSKTVESVLGCTIGTLRWMCTTTSRPIFTHSTVSWTTKSS